MTSTDIYDDEGYDEGSGHHYDDEPPRRSRLGRAVLVAVILALLAGGLGAVAIQRKIDPPGAPGAAVAVTIPKGSSTSRIAAILDGKGVISSATVFRYYLKMKGEAPFEAGIYRLQRNEDFDSVIAQLRRGGEVAYTRLTVPEGKTLKQTADLVGKLPGRSGSKFLQLAASGQVHSEYQPAGSANLEGLLFPDTYNIGAKDDELAIIKRMSAEFETRAGAAFTGSPNAKLNVTPYQALVVASLVETESKVDIDRAKIAQVIYNRLARGMPLQIDATVLYAREATGAPRRPGGRVLFSDLKLNSPYNTYVVKGLPPTPIAGFGAASLDAALHPQPGPWLYYVKTETDGRHAFATTLAEHNRNIADAKRRGINP
ncbi:MAG: hypothetical protein QOJ09_756 [Actinomycetota bacterium]|nr:hypothetical protein [Actinomycetota bacterium]